MNKNMWKSHAEVMLRQPVGPPAVPLTPFLLPSVLKGASLSNSVKEGVGPNITITEDIRTPGGADPPLHAQPTRVAFSLNEQ